MLKLAIAGLLIVSGTLAWAFWPTAAEAEPKRIHIVTPEIKQSPKCASCGDARHPTKYLTKTEFHSLIQDFATAPLGQNAAIDALCYYGPQAEAFLNNENFSLPSGHRAS